MMAPDVEGVERKLTELVVRATSPYPSAPQRPIVGVIEGVRVIVAVGVDVRVNDGVRVTEAVGEIVGVRVLVAVGATPTRARYLAATQPVPPDVWSRHHTSPLALAGPLTTVP